MTIIVSSDTGNRDSNVGDEGGSDESDEDDIVMVEHVAEDILDGTRRQHREFTRKLRESIVFS